MLPHKLVRSRFLVLVFADLVCALMFAQAPTDLHRVNKFYTVIAGSSSRAQQFHDLLDRDLRQTGFELTEQASDADATLRVEFSAEARPDSSLARATFTIKNPAGRLIWSGDLFSAHRGEGPDTTVEDLAESCAERLRKDWEKGAK